MNRRIRIAILIVLAAALCCALTACKKGADGGDIEDPPKTPEEVRDKVRTLLDEYNDSNERSTSINFNDKAELDTYCTELKGIFESLAAIDFAEADKDAGVKFKGGAAKMLEYVGELPGYFELDEGSQEWTDKQLAIINTWSAAVGLITEGEQLLWKTADAPAGTVDAGETTG
jgi:hypothetical protein